jgi:excisionase family DNA binding protein
MEEVFFTTNEVAKMLQVDKSTVKRWTDENKLKCFRTPGGHRKFRAEDLYNFMSEYNYGVATLRMIPQMASDEAIIKRIVANKEFNVLHSVCFGAAIKGKKDEIITLFSEVHRAGLPLSSTFDHILRPTLKKMNDTFRSNKISVIENHLALNALSGAIVQLADSIAHQTKNEKTIICTSLEAEKNDIEFKALTTLLEIDGYAVLNLGVGMSPEIIGELIGKVNPFAVCLYTSVSSDPKKLMEDTRIVVNAKSKNIPTYVVGGQAYVDAMPAYQSLNVKLCNTFEAFDDFRLRM